MAVTTVSTPGLAWIATTLAPCAASLILEVRLHTIEKLFQSLAERRVKKFAGAGAHGGNNCFDPRIGMDRNYLGSLRGVLDPRNQPAPGFQLVRYFDQHDIGFGLRDLNDAPVLFVGLVDIGNHPEWKVAQYGIDLRPQVVRPDQYANR